jgi:hypothetical protein
MKGTRNRAKPGKSRTRSRALGLLCLCALAGCSTSGQRAGDPLVGEIHPNYAAPYANTPPNNPQPPTKTASDPLIPGPTAPQVSANTVSQTSLQGGRPLAIEQTAAYPGSSTGFAPTFGGQPTVVTLQNDVASTSSYSPPAPSNAPPQQTTDILLAQLRSRGVQWQKQDIVPEGIRFTCIVPNRNNPESMQIYEATARDYATAVQAVLVKIDHP